MRRRWSAILLATAMVMGFCAPAAAIDPVPAEGHPYSVGDELHYHWGYPLDPSGTKWNPPDYARDAFDSATVLHANASTLARAPEFVKGGSGVQYRTWGSTGSWTNDLTLTTDDSGHWSGVHAYSSPVDREWRAKSLDESMIQHDYTTSIRVQWPTQC